MIILRQKEFVGKSNPALNFMNTKSGFSKTNKINKRILESGIKTTNPKAFQQYERNNPTKVMAKIQNGRVANQPENFSHLVGGRGVNSAAFPNAGAIQPPLVNNANSFGITSNMSRYTQKGINPKVHLNPTRTGNMNINIDRLVNANAITAQKSMFYK